VEEFATVELNDARLNQRCQALAAKLAQQPQASINQASEDWQDTKAAYRFFQNKRVSAAQILAPHVQRTVARLSQQETVLAIQDTTFFNYSHHPKTRGLGLISNKKQNQHGLGLHSTLVTTPDGLALGVLTQQFFLRAAAGVAHEPHELRKLPIEQKESYKWLAAFEQTIRLTPAGVQVVTVCDREGDIYEMFALAQGQAAALLVRASSDRRLADEATAKLWAQVGRQPLAGTLLVAIPARDNQPARQAVVQVRFTTLTLQPPWRPRQQKLPRVTLQAVWVKEENPPDHVTEPIEWLLLTNLPVHCLADATQVIGYYCTRWQIEVYHKVLKSGCQVEDCRLQTADRLQNYIALMSVIAWRLHWLTYINRTAPALPCTVILTTVEWQTLYRYTHKTLSLPLSPPTVHQAVRWLARLGGFLGRQHDREPGVTVIWRGWQRLQDMAATWYLVNEHSQLVGNS